jgi:pimeloyl-ACP methyl ester carboxylesterase
MSAPSASEPVACATAGDERVAFATLADGRRIAFREFGAAGGKPVLALHGTPGSRLKFAMADAAAQVAGLRLVCPDRWGYGHTDAHPRPSLAAFADDIGAFAGRIGLDRFAVLGVSGGGPYAAAVAAGLGRRVTALALVAPVGPIAGTPAGLRLSPFHLLAFRGLSRTPGAMRLAFLGFRALLAHDAPLAMRIASSRAARVDRRTVCRPAERQSLIDAFRAGLAPGADGPAIDMRLFGRRWDIAPERYEGPARLWLGDADRHVPQAAARLLAQTVPGCTLVPLAGAGHYWVLEHMADVLDWIAAAGPAATDRAE